MSILYIDGCANGCASVLYENGVEQSMRMKYVLESNVLHTNYMALEMGLHSAIQRGIYKLRVRCENIEFTKQLINKTWDTYLDTLFRQFENIQFEYTFRHENKRVKQLSREASKGIL